MRTCLWSGNKSGIREHSQRVNFDRIAPHYDRLERWFSRGLMHQARTAHLSVILQCRHVLLLGEGSGRFLPPVLQQFPDARVTCIDSSTKMLTLARDEVSAADRERVDFIEADIRTWQPATGQFDLIVTNFFLDCFGEDELAQLIPRIARTAARDANWLVADFNVPRHGFARWRAAFIIGVLYRFFRFTTGLSARELISPESSLERAGFKLRRRVEFDHGLVRSDWWVRG
jgi:ubiquinone/menaquinone biosynthesis C-methylase UbiE